MALHNYNNTYGGLPPAYTVDANGKPLHSWRTLFCRIWINALYEKIDLQNRGTIGECGSGRDFVGEYDCPSAYSELERNRTVYLAVVTPDSCIRPTKVRPISEVTDGLPNTLMVLEVPVNYAVPWMSPQDADFVVLSSISGRSSLRWVAGLADGVKFLSSDISGDAASLTTEEGGVLIRLGQCAR